MKNKVFIQPNPEKNVDGKPLRLFNPDTKSEIPKEGAIVILDSYWKGMLDREQIIILEEGNNAPDTDNSTENRNGVDLSDAFDLLEEGNKAHWTKDGKPEVKALADILGRNVSAKERDEAWNKYNKEGE